MSPLLPFIPKPPRGARRCAWLVPPGFRTAGTIVVALSLQLGSPGVATAQPVPTATASSAALLLGPGDRVNVSVFGQPELSGDHTLDGDGNIMLVIGGPIAAANLTATQLERRIAETLGNGYLVRPRVSVRIGELRPVYVLSNSRGGGEVPYRYGMTVLTALAIAGGATSNQDLTASQSELLAVEERLQVMLNQRISLRARIARLAAQRDGAQTLMFPSDLDTGSQTTSRLLAGERAVFNSERDAEIRQINLLVQRMKDSETEVTSIAEQVKLSQQQLDVINVYLTDLGKLVRSGLVERRRVIDMQQERARIESHLAQLGTQSVRAAQVVREAPLLISNLRGSTHQRALAELQDANMRLSELTTSIDAARDSLSMRREQLGGVGMVRAAGRAVYIVTRSEVGGARTFEAQETTALRPGDILRVSGRLGTVVTDAGLDSSSNANIKGQ